MRTVQINLRDDLGMAFSLRLGWNEFCGYRGMARGTERQQKKAHKDCAHIRGIAFRMRKGDRLGSALAIWKSAPDNAAEINAD
jgi:hypothetical protein